MTTEIAKGVTAMIGVPKRKQETKQQEWEKEIKLEKVGVLSGGKIQITASNVFLAPRYVFLPWPHFQSVF